MGNRIRELREARNMSQVRLSIELAVSQETVSAYESGKHFPSYASLIKLREIFGASIDYIMGLDAEACQTDRGLTSDEKALLDCYRKLSPLRREKALSYLEGLSS